jgi:hypothetical protein
VVCLGHLRIVCAVDRVDLHWVKVYRDRVRRDRVRRDWEVAETGKIFVEVFPQLNRNRPIFHHLHRRRLHRENVLALKEAGLADQSI